MSVPIFHSHKTIRFAHCDAAGIAFYPQLVTLIHEVQEDWFGHMGWPYKRMHLEAGLGVPTAKINLKFHSPLRLGDEVEFGLSVKRLSDRSVDIAVLAAIKGQLPSVSAEASLVLVDLTTMKSRPWPDDLKQHIQQWAPAESVAS
ncbi:acyl-CoA thioesterase [Lacibacterium aquatile]|uniref:Acyl-CoA thioesterase n=1 Tax=Lacibacterium aquatile TaxID=1168082 RepID=A0ABW5DY72_9PROT